MRFNQPSYPSVGIGSNYFPFNVAALASMSNQQLEVGNECCIYTLHATIPQLIWCASPGTRQLAQVCANCYLWMPSLPLCYCKHGMFSLIINRDCVCHQTSFIKLDTSKFIHKSFVGTFAQEMWRSWKSCEFREGKLISYKFWVCLNLHWVPTNINLD